MSELIVLRSFEECIAYKESWGKLVEVMPYPTPFAHPDWVLTTLDLNRHSIKPFIIILKILMLCVSESHSPPIRFPATSRAVNFLHNLQMVEPNQLQVKD